MADLSSKIEQLSLSERQKLKEAIKEKLDTKKKGESERRDYGVVIMGGGLAGLSLTYQLKKAHPHLKILVLEKSTFPAPEAAHKVGESLPELSSHYFSQILGLSEHMDNDQLEKAGVRYYFTNGGNVDIANRLEIGLKDFPPVKGYQLDRGRFENFLHQEVIRMGVEFLEGTIVLKTAKTEDGLHQVFFQRTGREGDVQEVQSRWIVDASGRGSVLKRQFHLAEKTNHSANAVWFRVKDVIDIDQWSNDPEWRKRTRPGVRKTGTVHLKGKGYWVWIILLKSGQTSVGIVSDPKYFQLEDMNRFEKALEWLRKHEPQLHQVVLDRVDLLQDFKALKHFSHSCKRVYSGERWAITGDAGVFLDPYYSPGNDFVSMSNCLVADLIAKDLRGEEIQGTAEQYNLYFLSFFKRYLATYENQYGTFGNPAVSTNKIIWDWAIYWAVNAFLFFQQNRQFDMTFVASVREELDTFNRLNQRMQEQFTAWGEMDFPHDPREFLSLLDIKLLYRLHTGMVATFADEMALKKMFRQNVEDLVGLAATIENHLNSLVSIDTLREYNQNIFCQRKGSPLKEAPL